MKVLNVDCFELINKIDIKNSILVIDPPFNIGYHYGKYKDNLPEVEYYKWISNIINHFEKVVIIHYPESIFKIANVSNRLPQKTVSWVYNSNTAKQHRMIAYFGIKPDFTLIKQPYKNPNDKRIKERIKNGSKGSRLYDWWNINQVKNVSKQKTAHPCQMPLEVMLKVIGIIPTNETIVDVFSGSGTTGVACKHLNRKFIGSEIDSEYCQIANKRINEYNIQLKEEL